MISKLHFTFWCVLFSFITQAQSWVDLAGGADNWVVALKGDDQNGILYAGGSFTEIGGNSNVRISKWDGVSWTSIGSGMDYPVHALEVIDNTLYAGGEFLNVDGVWASRIAKYDGNAWSPMGFGIGGSVNAIAEYNDEIYVGHLDNNDNLFPGIKKWSDNTWAPVGDALSGPNVDVLALKVYNDELYVAGDFESVGGVTVNGIAKWNGTTWSALGTGLGEFGLVNTLEVYNGELYVGGRFETADGIAANCLAKWDGTNWYAVGDITGGVFGFSTCVNALRVVGNDLFLAGNFTDAAGTGANYIARYNGNTFFPLGSGTNERVYRLDAFGGDLIAAGQFSQAGGNTVNNIAAWTLSDGVNERGAQHEVQVYPNPFHTSTTIRFDHVIANANLTLCNQYGQVVKTISNFTGDRIIIERSNLSSGIYFYEVLQSGSSIVKGKLLVN